MKRVLLFLCCLTALIHLEAQRVAINESGNPPDASAMLDVSSTTKGLLIPRMTGNQRAMIGSPANGLIVYQTDNSLMGDGPRGFYLHDNGVWKRMARAEELGWTVSGSTVFTTLSGGVGIGTTSVNSSALLEMSSTSKGLLIPRMTSLQRALISSPQQGLTVYQTNGTSGYWFYDGSAWQRLAKASELTGSQSWTIIGEDQYSNVGGNVGIGISSGINQKFFLKGNALVTHVNGNDLVNGGNIAKVKIHGANTGSGVLEFLRPDTTAGATISYAWTGDAMSLRHAESASYMRFYDTGNIGIGTGLVTNEAQSKFHIAEGDFVNLDDHHGYLLLGSLSGLNTALSHYEIQARDNGVAAPLYLQHDGSMVRIGSGTIATGAKLQISGGVEASLTTHGQMLIGSVTSSNLVFDENEIQARINGGASTLRLQQDGGALLVQSNSLVVGTNGNVGIGDNTPDEKLHIAGNVLVNATNPTIQLQNEGIDKGFVQLSGDNIRIGTNSANDLGKVVFRTNSVDRVFVDGAGNMGVGVASPGSKLDVAGRINISFSGEALKIDGNNSFMQFYQNGVVKYYIQQLGDNLRIGHATGNSTGDLRLAGQQIYMTATEVAINTSNGPAPGYSLSVGGEIICEELRVELEGNAPWPDYVFAHDYKLRPLHELKSFVTKNKHLPNIPAAAQVEDEGFDVGDMNRRLLEKVEELTLYIIQQEEKIEALNARMNEYVSARKTKRIKSVEH